MLKRSNLKRKLKKNSSASKAFKKVKEKSVSWWKAKVWKAFSEYIRQKYSDKDGNVLCYTCGRKGTWRQMQCGHAIGGRHNAILFCEEAVRVQCVGCNVFLRGNYAKFHANLEAEMGFGILQKLLEIDKQTVSYSVNDLKSLLNKYTNGLPK